MFSMPSSTSRMSMTSLRVVSSRVTFSSLRLVSLAALDLTETLRPAYRKLTEPPRIGGAIGTGLFIGSGAILHDTG